MLWARVTGMAAALCMASAAYADTLVVRSSGPSAKSYPAGRKLADGGSVVLKGGDVVTLLDAKGTRTLRGPGSFGVTASTAQVSSAPLTALLDTKRVRRARTGAVRGTIGEAAAVAPRRPNLWLVDMAQPGALCFADPAAVRLWRADAAKAATLRVSGGGKAATVGFAAGESIAAWPAALPVMDGAAYRIEGAKAVDVRFAGIGAADAGLDKVADALIAKGCEAQLDLLVDTAAAR